MRWYRRWPLKLVIFVVGTALVLFPKVWLIPAVLERYGDMNSALDPEHPGVAALNERVRAELPAGAPVSDVLQMVERSVCEQVPYAWDWDVWGVAEYLPTVAEVFERGREDCDGRAVVAASLLRRMGYDAWLVSDLLHVWVQTPEGETMSPTGAEKTFVATEEGTEATISTGMIRNLGRGFSYGVAVFPLERELIILALLCLVAMQPWSSVWRRVAGCLLLWVALDTLRDAGRQAALSDQGLFVVRAWLGIALGVAGWLVLAVRAGGPRPRSAARRPE
jgi:hypothetical protein